MEMISFEFLNEPIIFISEYGLIEPLSLRTNKEIEQEPETYFGFTNLIGDNPLNDIILPGLRDDQICRYNRQFYIKYFNKHFYVKDLGNGFGVFIKLKSSIKLKNNSLFNIGDTFIVAQLEKDDNEDTFLTLKIFMGILKHDPVRFFRTKGTIILGRSIDCDVSINDNLLSRHHCNITYKEDGWYLEDGSIDASSSTNGTWIYASDEYELKDNDIIKSNSVVIRIKICDKETENK